MVLVYRLWNFLEPSFDEKQGREVDQKKGPRQKGDFALDGHEPFMRGTWVRRHGLILKEV